MAFGESETAHGVIPAARRYRPLLPSVLIEPFERVNIEVKCRSRVIGIQPSDAAAMRLVGAPLAQLPIKRVPL